MGPQPAIYAAQAGTGTAFRLTQQCCAKAGVFCRHRLRGTLFSTTDRNVAGSIVQDIAGITACTALSLASQRPPLRHELGGTFSVPNEQLTLLFVVPIMMIVNSNLRNPPLTRSELLEKRFFGRVLAPDAITPVSLALHAILRDIYALEAERFLDHLAHGGTPFEAAMAVNRGVYDVGIMPLPFTRYCMAPNIYTIWPNDGALGLPEMLLIHKDAGAEVKKLAPCLLEKEV